MLNIPGKLQTIISPNPLNSKNPGSDNFYNIFPTLSLYIYKKNCFENTDH